MAAEKKLGNLWIVLLVLLAACTSGGDEKVRKPQGTPTLPTVAWQRPQQPISQEAPIVRLTGTMVLHQGTVNGVAFSASGTRLASAGADNTTAIWNLANGEALFVQSNIDGRRVFWGPGDETVVTVSPEGVARILAVVTGASSSLEERVSFSGSNGLLSSVAQSPDRTLLAFGDENGGIRLWRIPEGTLAAEIAAHRQHVFSLSFSPDGTLLASISSNHGLKVWSIPSGEMLYDLGRGDTEENPLSPVTSMFSPDSKILAVANETGIQTWDMGTGESIYFVETAQNAASNALKYSSDGRLLVGCGAQALIGVWAAESGQTLALLPIPGAACSGVAFSPDGTLLLTLPSPGRDLYLWNVAGVDADTSPETKKFDRADRQTMGLFPGTRFFDIAWSPDGRFIIVLDELGPLYALTALQ